MQWEGGGGGGGGGAPARRGFEPRAGVQVRCVRTMWCAGSAYDTMRAYSEALSTRLSSMVSPSRTSTRVSPYDAKPSSLERRRTYV